MNIALLNTRITIQQQTTTVDTIGNHINTWQDYYTCAATVSGETNGETEEAATTVDDTNACFTIRYCALVSAITNTNFRVDFDGQLYDILSVDHQNYKRKSIKPHCRKARR